MWRAMGLPENENRSIVKNAFAYIAKLANFLVGRRLLERRGQIPQRVEEQDRVPDGAAETGQELRLDLADEGMGVRQADRLPRVIRDGSRFAFWGPRE